MSSDLKLINYSRKRKHELVIQPKVIRQISGPSHNITWDVLDLVSLLNQLTLFDDRIERINVKDMICQEFTDRIGKLYKPVAMEKTDCDGDRMNRINERLKNIYLTKKISRLDEYTSITKDDCPLHTTVGGFLEYERSHTLFIEYEISTYLQESMLGFLTEDLHPQCCNFEDIVMGLAVIYLKKTHMHSDNLKRVLCKYVGTISNETVENSLIDYDSDYDSDNCEGNFNTQKRKRRKLLVDSSMPLPEY